MYNQYTTIDADDMEIPDNGDGANEIGGDDDDDDARSGTYTFVFVVVCDVSTLIYIIFFSCNVK